MAHLSYELSKKLKDAGFPQEYAKSIPLMDFAYDEGEELHMLHKDNDTYLWTGNNYTTIAKDYSDNALMEVQRDFIKCPTLSELIEACGPFFYQLINIGSEFGYHWGATYRSMIKELKSEGSTPEEAVANLYLALNKE